MSSAARRMSHSLSRRSRRNSRCDAPPRRSCATVSIIMGAVEVSEGECCRRCDEPLCTMFNRDITFTPRPSREEPGESSGPAFCDHCRKRVSRRFCLPSLRRKRRRRYMTPAEAYEEEQMRLLEEADIILQRRCSILYELPSGHFLRCSSFDEDDPCGY